MKLELETITFEAFTEKVIRVAAQHGNPVIDGGVDMFHPSRKGRIELNIAWKLPGFADYPTIRIRSTKFDVGLVGVNIHSYKIEVVRGGCATLGIVEFKEYADAVNHMMNFITALAFPTPTFLIPGPGETVQHPEGLCGDISCDCYGN